MMFDRAYRQRLEADLARWEADGLITPAVLAGIRSALPPLAPGVNIPVVVAIVGGLLIAAAFLAFVAAYWTELARLLGFAILAAGIVGANGLAAWFGRAGRTILADLCASVGAIIFGAGIALVGQMYHLGEDFAGAMLLWAGGALAAAALTESRGTLAVALVAGSIWSAMRVYETHDLPHLPFVAFWLIAGGLALTWNSRVAAHLVALASLPWWISAALHLGFDPNGFNPLLVLADGAALLLGGGLALAAAPWPRAICTGAALSNYGAFSLAGVATFEVAISNVVYHWTDSQPVWANGCGVAGVIFAFGAAAITRQAGAALAGAAIGLVLVTAAIPRPQAGEPWLAYAVELSAMLCLVVSGVLDAVRPRIVAGWIGIAGVATITWAVKGSLLRRSAFLAVAGAVAVAFATMLNRLRARTEQ
jgi:uncharacterized membrane protein